MCESWETLPGTYRVCTVHRSWDGITVHTLWALMYRRHCCAVCRRRAPSRGGRTAHGAWEVRGEHRAGGAEHRRCELSMEQRQQGRRRARRAVPDEPQQRGLWEASLLPVAVTVPRALTL